MTYHANRETDKKLHHNAEYNTVITTADTDHNMQI